MACLRTSRTVPDSRDSLTMWVMSGTRLSMQAFRNPVEIGSRAQLFVGDFRTSSHILVMICLSVALIFSSAG